MAIRDRQAAIDWEDVSLYQVTYQDGDQQIVACKGLPAIRDTVRRNVDEDGCVRPCIWTTREPYGVAIRADLVVSVREVTIPRGWTPHEKG